MHHTLDIMKIKSFKGGYDDNFCYLVWDDITLEGALVDPSVSPDQIFHFINKNNIQLSKVLITHTHYDHVYYLSDIIRVIPNIEIYAYINTRYSFKNNFIGVNHNDKIRIGAKSLDVLYTPGHYDDSICFFDSISKIIFTGDTIFVGRSGRTINKHSNTSVLYKSIYNIILPLPLDTIIYPGHDYGPQQTISISDNIKSSSFFSCKNEQEFISVMEKFELSR